MSRLYSVQSGAARRKLAYEELYQPHPARFIAAGNDELYHYAAEVIGRDNPITYLEFGVANGHSLQKITREFCHPASLFVGFDSFVGLPEPWMMHGRGAFSNRGVAPEIGDERVKFVKGWFQNTLHRSLTWILPMLSDRVLIHYDADLYSSTLFLLSSLWPHCKEYYFIMDDFMVDDIVALHDFSLSFPVKIDFLGRRQGGIPHSIFGRMVRVEFVLPVGDEAPSDILERAEGLVNSGQFGNALPLWNALRNDHPKLMAAWVRAAYHLQNHGRAMEAEALLNDARRLFPDEAEPTAQWAILAQLQKDWPEALRRWKSAREQFPNHTAPYYGCAVALRELGRLSEAEALLTDALRRFPKDPGVALEHAWLPHMRKDWSVALPRWANARTVAPHHPGGYIWGAQALSALGRADEAEVLLREACNLLPQEAGVVIELARFFENKGDWVRAEEYWLEVTNRFPGTKGANERLVIARARQ